MITTPTLLRPSQASGNTRTSAASLALAAGSLAPGATYSLRLTATNAQGSSSAVVTFSTSPAPTGAFLRRELPAAFDIISSLRVLASEARGATCRSSEADDFSASYAAVGQVAVQPLSGTAGSTLFTATVPVPSPIQTGEVPLGQRAQSYEFSYRVTGRNGTAVAGGASGVLRAFSPVPTASFLLPAPPAAAGDDGIAYDVEVSVRSMSADGTYSAVATTQQVQVLPAPAADGASASFAAAVAAAAAAVGQGRTEEAVSRVAALALLLPADSAAATSAARSSLLGVLSQAATVAYPSEAGAEAISAALAAVVAAPGASLEGPAQDLALSLISTAVVNSSFAAVSSAAAASVLASLDAVAGMSSDGARLAAVFAAADALGQSLLDGLMPGEAPPALVGQRLRLSVQVDSAASPATRLSTQPIALAGAPAVSFGPIPPAALANATVAAPTAADAASAVLRSMLLVSALDPYSAGALAPVARFTVAKGDGTALNVAPGQSVTFSLPSPPEAAGEVATCTFWCALTAIVLLSRSSGVACMRALLLTGMPLNPRNPEPQGLRRWRLLDQRLRQPSEPAPARARPLLAPGRRCLRRLARHLVGRLRPADVGLRRRVQRHDARLLRRGCAGASGPNQTAHGRERRVPFAQRLLLRGGAGNHGEVRCVLRRRVPSLGPQVALLLVRQLVPKPELDPFTLSYTAVCMRSQGR